MMRARALWLILAALPGAAIAQNVGDCAGRAEVGFLMEPWEENTRTFVGERVRLAVLDRRIPAEGPFWLLVIAPPFDAMGQRQCQMVGASADAGFAAIRLDGLDARYDPQTGLAVDLPVATLGAGGLADAMLSLVIDPASGAITAEIGGAP